VAKGLKEPQRPTFDKEEEKERVKGDIQNLTFPCSKVWAMAATYKKNPGSFSEIEIRNKPERGEFTMNTKNLTKPEGNPRNRRETALRVGGKRRNVRTRQPARASIREERGVKECIIERGGGGL